MKHSDGMSSEKWSISISLGLIGGLVASYKFDDICRIVALLIMIAAASKTYRALKDSSFIKTIAEIAAKITGKSTGNRLGLSHVIYKLFEVIERLVAYFVKILVEKIGLKYLISFSAIALVIALLINSHKLTPCLIWISSSILLGVAMGISVSFYKAYVKTERKHQVSPTNNL